MFEKCDSFCYLMILFLFLYKRLINKKIKVFIVCSIKMCLCKFGIGVLNYIL